MRKLKKCLDLTEKIKPMLRLKMKINLPKTPARATMQMLVTIIRMLN